MSVRKSHAKLEKNNSNLYYADANNCKKIKHFYADIALLDAE